MKKEFKNFLILLTATSLIPTVELRSIDLIIETEEGESTLFEINPGDTINELLQEANLFIDKNINIRLIDSASNEETLVSRFEDPRNYYAPVSESALKDMRFIILTLGNEPLLKLKQYKKELTDAGDRLKEVHPLNFWNAIFSDEKMTSAFYNIKRRGKVWKSFIKGMGKSLQEAVDGNNLKDAYIEDFATKVNVDARLIINSIKECDWNEFAKQLLTHVRKQGNMDRYDQ